MAKKEQEKENERHDTIAVVVLIFGLLGGIGIGYLIWYHPSTVDTTVNITVDSGFGLSWNNTIYNATYNCSIVGIDCITFSRNVFTAIDNYFAANHSKLLGTNNLSSETGTTQYTAGFNDIAYSPDASYWGNPSNTSRCEGTTTKFTLGDMVALFPVVWVGVWYNGSIHYNDFTFQEIATLMTDLNNGALNRTTWNNATKCMWRSVDNITIYDWQVDLDTLLVNYNGVNMTLISAPMP